MQELEIKHTEAKIEIIDKEAFEQNINEIVKKYSGYTMTAATIKDDKQVLASLRKLVKQISDKRIEIKKELTAPVTDFEAYVKKAIDPLNKVISSIDKDIKDYEAHQKQLRLDTVKGYIANKATEYMLDPRLFDEKAQNYLKASDFMADGVTLKKATMKSLDDTITFEYQKQQEFEKSKAAISGQCAEYGMTDQPYIRMLKDLTLVEVLEQIKSDYLFEQEKQKMRQAEEEQRQLFAAKRAKEQEQAQKSQETPLTDPETGEILSSGQLHQNEQNALTGAENGLKRYTQKMTLEVYFEDTAEKDRFKDGLSQLGFEHKQNYQVSGYQRIEPVTQEQINELCGW